MSRFAVLCVILAASAAAMDLYNEISPADFDDYEMGDETDAGPARISERNHDLEDWTRNMIFFKLMKALQNYRLNRPDYYEESNSMPNIFDTPEARQPYLYAKRASDVIENVKAVQKHGNPRPLSKSKAKKEKALSCNFKFCALLPPTLE